MKKLYLMILALVMTVLATAITVYAGGDEVEITTDEPYNMYIGVSGEIVKFSPEEDGWYKFYTTGDYDTYVTIYNSNWDEIKSADDTNDGYNFCLKCELYQGYTYYLKINYYAEEDGETAQFPLYVEEAVVAVDVTITQEPYNMTVIEGFETVSMYCDGLEAEFTLSDGSVVDWSYVGSNAVGDGNAYVFVDNDGYGHYYIDLICENAYTRLFFDTVSNTKSYLLNHYVYDNASNIELYVPAAGTYQVVFADYTGNRLSNIDIVNFDAGSEGMYGIISEHGLLLDKDDKIMLWSDTTSLKPLCAAYTIR